MPRRKRQAEEAEELGATDRPVFLSAARRYAERRKSEDRCWSVPLKRGSLEELVHAMELCARNAVFNPDPEGYSTRLFERFEQEVQARQNRVSAMDRARQLAGV